LPAAGAGAETVARWHAGGEVTVDATVLVHEEGARSMQLESTAGEPFTLLYGGPPVPLAIDATYRFTTYAPPPSGPDLGAGLLVEDDAGLVFLGLTAEAAPGAIDALLAGARGGVELRQLPTTCAPAAQDGCGYALRAAPVEVSIAGETATVSPGGTAALAGLRIDLHASHIRQWAASVPCDVPAEPVLSISIARSE
jgi:hypothetical protein